MSLPISDDTERDWSSCHFFRERVSVGGSYRYRSRRRSADKGEHRKGVDSGDPDNLKSDFIMGFQIMYATTLVSDSMPGDQLAFICEMSRSSLPIAN